MFDNEWGGALAMAQIEGVWMHGPWVMTDPYKLNAIAKSKVKDNVGDGECVAIAQWTLKMPNTSLWRPGVRVLGNDTPTYYEGHKVIGVNSGITPGTVIATFVDKRYQNNIHGNHVAIYLSQTKNSIKVYDQWNKKDKKGNIVGHQEVHIRDIHIGGNGLVNDANAFSIVYTLTGDY